jgi:DnaJ-class molecular chaperone
MPTDFATPARKPGPCPKCRGTGTYSWGAVTNGKPAHQGPCHSCRGTGRQSRSDIHRNYAYNRHKISRLTLDRD